MSIANFFFFLKNNEDSDERIISAYSTNHLGVKKPCDNCLMEYPIKWHKECCGKSFCDNCRSEHKSICNKKESIFSKALPK